MFPWRRVHPAGAPTQVRNAPITPKNVTKTQLYFLSVNWEVLCFCILMFLQPNDVWGLGSNVWALQGGPDLPGASHKHRPAQCGGLDAPGWDESLYSHLLLFNLRSCSKHRTIQTATTNTLLSNIRYQPVSVVYPQYDGWWMKSSMSNSMSLRADNFKFVWFQCRVLTI